MQPEKIVFPGRIVYRLSGYLHREDGPASHWLSRMGDGSKFYHIYGTFTDDFDYKRTLLSIHYMKNKYAA